MSRPSKSPPSCAPWAGGMRRQAGRSAARRVAGGVAWLACVCAAPVAWAAVAWAAVAWAAVAWAAVASATTAWGAEPPAAATDQVGPAARLSFIDSLYRERDDFRAESEILAFLAEAPRHPLRPQVELARAKLHYRAGRFADADLMLLSLLDRTPPPPVAQEARRLLGFSWLRQGRLAEAAPLLNREPDLDPLQQPPPYDARRAVAWSTGLPGSGFFVLGEPGRAFTSLGLNLLLVAGAAVAYEQNKVPVALLFAIVEAAFYTGGREAVREEAGRLNERWLRERRETWLSQSSEPRLMARAFELKF